MKQNILTAAVLVWLNYKNAYEYWNEQRMALNKEVQRATQQVMDKLPLGALAQQTAPALGTLFLQLTVEDLGICLPMDSFTQVCVQIVVGLTYMYMYLSNPSHQFNPLGTCYVLVHVHVCTCHLTLSCRRVNFGVNSRWPGIVLFVIIKDVTIHLCTGAPRYPEPRYAYRIVSLCIAKTRYTYFVARVQLYIS